MIFFFIEIAIPSQFIMYLLRNIRNLFVMKKSLKRPKIVLQEQEKEGEINFQEYSFVKTKSSIQKKPKNISESHLDTLALLREWRKNNQAPIDTMGCDRLYDQNAEPLIQKYQILISVLLSVQTNDKVTSQVILKMRANGVLDPKIIEQMSIQKIEQHIKKVNFHKKKAKNMKQIARIFLKNGPPKNLEQVMQYPGVGVKVVAQGIVSGIGVDTHVHRICNRLGWVSTEKPQKTESALQLIFQKKYWLQINELIVGFGQTVCEAKNPKCGICPIVGQCPYTAKNL